MNKNKFLILLMTPLCVSLGACNNKESDEQYFSHFEPIVRFAVTSDAHISADKTQLQGLKRFKSVYEDTYNYAQTQSYKGFDHVIVVGDGADDGGVDSLKIFADAVKEQNQLYNVQTHAVMGNHELTDLTSPGYDALVSRYKNVMGYDKINYSFTIGPADNRFHFIMFSPSDEIWNYDDDNVCIWLENEIKAALDDDPSKSKPIFVCQHIGFKDTTYRTDVTYMNKLSYDGYITDALSTRNMLRKYPQVVDFSGHSHGPITDPRAVYQDGFTAITTGTLCYYNIDIVDAITDHVFPIYDENGNTGGRCEYSLFDYFLNDDGGEFIIFEVDKTGASKMMIMDANSHKFIGDTYYFRSFASSKDFRYTAARRDTDPIAEFDNVQYDAPEITSTSVEYWIPQAKYAQHYRCSLFKEEKHLGSIYRLTDSWRNPQPTKFVVDFDNLTPNTRYKIKVVPVNSWGKEAKNPLTLEFQTKLA